MFSLVLLLCLNSVKIRTPTQRQRRGSVIWTFVGHAISCVTRWRLCLRVWVNGMSLIIVKVDWQLPRSCINFGAKSITYFISSRKLYANMNLIIPNYSHYKSHCVLFENINNKAGTIHRLIPSLSKTFSFIFILLRSLTLCAIFNLSSL